MLAIATTKLPRPTMIFWIVPEGLCTLQPRGPAAFPRSDQVLGLAPRADFVLRHVDPPSDSSPQVPNVARLDRPLKARTQLRPSRRRPRKSPGPFGHYLIDADRACSLGNRGLERSAPRCSSPAPASSLQTEPPGRKRSGGPPLWRTQRFRSRGFDSPRVPYRDPRKRKPAALVVGIGRGQTNLGRPLIYRAHGQKSLLSSNRPLQDSGRLPAAAALQSSHLRARG